MPLKVLDTVPRAVRALFASPETLNVLAGGRVDVARRLVTYQDMRMVWSRIGEHPDVELPVFFFMAAVELPAAWQKMPRMGTADLRRGVAQIAKLANTLARALEDLDGEIRFLRGSPLTFHHVMVRARTVRGETAGTHSAPDGWHYALQEKYKGDPTVADFLKALAAELKPSRASRSTLTRPRGIKSKNAERTFMVRELALFLNSAFGHPRFDIAAPTVNALLDERDNPLDANHAAKLVPGLF